MTRYEHIRNGGIEETAKAMAFLVVRSMTDECESLLNGVEQLKPSIINWLEEEIEDGD